MANEQYMAMQIQVELREAISSLSHLSNEMKNLSFTVNDSEEKNKKFDDSFKNATETLEKAGKTIKRTKTSLDEFQKETNKSGKSADKTGKEFKEMGEEANKSGKKGKKGIKELSDEAGNASKNVSFFKDIFKANLAMGAIKTVGKAIWNFGKNAVNVTKNFQSSMNEVYTLLPNITQPQMQKMKDDILDLSNKFGVLPEKTVPALYQALSAGVPKDNVMSFLETAQKGATAGVADIETSVDGLSSIVNAWGEKNINAAQASDLMFTAVKQGKTTFKEIASGISKVGPLAASLGVQFGDVSAALASMTSKGTPTEVAMTQLKAAFSELSQGTSKVSKEFKAASGKSFKEFIASGGNLQGALKILEERSKKTGKGINELFGSAEAAQVALSLTGEGAKKFADDIEAMKNATGATDTAFETMNKGIEATWNKLNTNFTTRLIKLGDAMAPTIEKIGNIILGIFPYIDQLGASFNSPMFLEFNKLMIEIGKIISATLVPTLIQLVGIVGGVLMNIFQNFMAHGDQFKTIFEGLSNVIVVFGGIFSSVFQVLGGIVNNLVSIFFGFFTGFMKAAGLTGNSGKKLSTTLSSAFMTIANIITSVYNFVRPILNFIAQLLGWVVGTQVKALLDLFNLLGNAINKVGGFFKKIFNKKDAEESKESLQDVNKELKELGKTAEKGATAQVEINKKENIETTIDYKQGEIPAPSTNMPAEIKFDSKNLSADIEKIGGAIQNNPQDATRNNVLNDLKTELVSVKTEIIAMKNFLGQKLDNVSSSIKNRNLILNVHGLTADEVVNKIRASLEKG
ncbi:phage tail tape measure protein [Leptotrichia sp. OH3620_COT-345]|uniref:phage tail tape measure protein n=1 Tax=Leptotrichia sp. OH3620_COT-345 TaxID=2491048 RepID=UPI000F64B72C|nr:phage tail tape measure protein [Leptotrichia sp. OH3620_COT-345]RRD38819.1 phage tail tape measure protein [Leptotrichia sp. OH3620_COT-345]